MARTSSTGKYAYFGQDGMGGGLSSENPIIVDKNKMVIADNILIGTAISRRKRGGQEAFYTGVTSIGLANTPIRGLIEYWRSAGLSSALSDLVLHQGTKLWSIDERNTPAVDRTGALVLSDAGVPSYQVFNGILYFCSTVTTDGYNKWDGVSASAVVATAPPDGPGKYLASHLGRMIMAGNQDFPYRVYFSSTFDPENWSTAAPADSTSFDLVDDGDPNGITGITSFQSRLYIFTRYSIYELTGSTPADAVLTKVSSGIGCVGQASICQIPNDVMFCSDRGIHSLRQIESGKLTTSTFLSRDIQKLWTTLINPTIFDRVMATFDDTINSYILSVPSSGQLKNDQLLVFNIEFGTWTVWPNIDARSLCISLVSNKKNILLGKEDGTLVYINRDSRNDLGVGYSARFKTAVLYPGGDMTTEKRFTNITVLAATTTPTQFSIGWSIDGIKSGSKSIELTAGEDLLGSTFILGQSKLGVGQYIPKTITIEDIGYGIQIEMIAGGTSDIEFYGFILEVEDANTRFT